MFYVLSALLILTALGFAFNRGFEEGKKEVWDYIHSVQRHAHGKHYFKEDE